VNDLWDPSNIAKW